mmetsp:Transcript_21099/g.38162  ORF Transcript_21099/g.38162 Transcript_21099/m.38162 type:complete len:302 (-) Transcript_21099:159-1064(-)
MSSWADASEDTVPLEQAPAEYTGGSGVRPRLHLKPRSATAGQDHHASGGGSSKSNPFGAAKPREEVLASKGIDASLVDKRVERKASVPRLSAEQDRQVEGLRAELTDIEEKLREANEMELPEEDFRVAAEEKRGELNELMEGFHKLNLTERNDKETEMRKERASGGARGGGGGGEAPGSPGGSRKFERPSERRRRLEQQRGEGGEDHHGGSRGGGGGRYEEGGADDNFSSFGGNRGGGGRGGGGRPSDSRGGRGGGGGYQDRGGGGGGYGNRDGGHDDNDGGYGGGGSRNDDKYAGDRYNY